MKIAITADLHLDPGYPERTHALENILHQIQDKEIYDLIIAGDLFDKDGDSSAYNCFRDPCRKHPSVRLHVIPGNHDPEKSLKDVSSDLPNLNVYTESGVKTFGDVDFLFIPYLKGISMGEELLRSKVKIGERPWCLIGHGDFIGGPREPNPLEKGVYMPLKQADLNDAQLQKVFLGHIHKPTPLNNLFAGKVVYSGSPQGVDSSESGPRRFLVYDTEHKGQILEENVNCSLLYLNETIVVSPSKLEKENLLSEFEKRLIDSKLSEDQLTNRTKIRIKIEGFTYEKEELVRSFHEYLSHRGLSLLSDETTDFDHLHTINDPEKEALADEALQILESCGWNFGGDQPTLEDTRKKVLESVYKV